MNPSHAPKMKYGKVRGRLTLELDSQAVLDLLTIKDTLQRESDSPTVPVSKSVAARRAFRMYAASLSTLAGMLQVEAERASESTYIHKRKVSR